ncbi:MAG: hypothetical protein AAFV72_14305 [Cyanobacteria bacterium J06635_1]
MDWTIMTHLAIALALGLIIGAEHGWQVRKSSEEMLALESVQAHPPTQAAGLVYASMLYGFCRDADRCQQQATTALRFSEQMEVPQYANLGVFYLGYALSLAGQGAGGLPLMQQAFHDRRASGIELSVSLMLILMADAHHRMGQWEAGLALLSEAKSAIAQNSERFLEAEHDRLMGELLLLSSAKNHETAAEDWFQRSLKVAQQQQARSFELRTATSLARLWIAQGKTQAAHDLLTPIYSSFDDGGGLPDLQAAQHLLERSGLSS